MGSDRQIIQFGPWSLDVDEGRLRRGDEVVELEPKTLDLLVLLHQHQGQVVGHETIMDRVWPDTVVTPGALARSISKLRKALGDDAQAPRYIETLPKRGYRLLAQEPVADPASAPKKRPRLLLAVAVGLVLSALVLMVMMPSKKSPEAEEPLLRRADDFYYQYTRADNESAMALYERIIAADPNSASATLGLANTLIQTVLRWPESLGEAPAAAPSLEDALVTGRVDAPRLQQTLKRAESLALRAVELDHQNAKAHRSLGLVYGALRRFDEAHRAYDRAVALDPNAWGALINRGELLTIQNQPQQALEAMIQAHAAMTARYDRDPVHIRPWYPGLGYSIAKRHAALGQQDEAEVWYRRVLDHSPFHQDSTVALAQLLEAAGDHRKAAELCRNLTERVGAVPGCAAILTREQDGTSR